MFKFYMYRMHMYTFKNVYSFQTFFIIKLSLIKEIYRLFLNEDLSVISRWPSPGTGRYPVRLGHVTSGEGILATLIMRRRN